MMVIERLAVAVCGVGEEESVTFTVKELVPVGPVGTPPIEPLVAPRLNPAGSAPVVIAKVNGLVPPVT